MEYKGGSPRQEASKKLCRTGSVGRTGLLGIATNRINDINDGGQQERAGKHRDRTYSPGIYEYRYQPTLKVKSDAVGAILSVVPRGSFLLYMYQARGAILVGGRSNRSGALDRIVKIESIRSRLPESVSAHGRAPQRKEASPVHLPLNPKWQSRSRC